MSRLKEKYQKEIRPKLQEKFAYKNSMLVPHLEKVVINMGLSGAAGDKGTVQEHVRELALIAGQQPVVTRARKSIAAFKLREGMPVGAMVTLRGERMLDFVDRFLNIDCPRIRDFRGFNKKGDGRGNYSIGLETQEIFHCLNLDDVKRSQGMQVTFVTTAKSDEECMELLEHLGVPFKKPEKERKTK